MDAIAPVQVCAKQIVNYLERHLRRIFTI